MTTSTSKVLPDVRPGQVWADNDPRSAGRSLRVEEVVTPDVDSSCNGKPYATCTVLTVARNVSEAQVGKRTYIRLDRFRPTSTGYRLVQDAEVTR